MPEYHQQLYTILHSMGLTEKEILIYLACHSFGPCAASILAKKTELCRSTTYDSLETLTNKGFITCFRKNDIRYYAAVHPHHLMKLLKMQKENLEKDIGQLWTVIENFESIQQKGSPCWAGRAF